MNPLSPKRPNKPIVIPGIKMASGHAGIKYKDRDDILIFTLPENSEVCGIFTKSTTASPAVIWSQKALSKNKPRAIIVNAGNANVFNGYKGKKTVKTIVTKIASILNIKPNQVLIAQTGVIGEPLEEFKILSCSEKILQNLKQNNWENAAKSIMTTDTFPKIASLKCKIGNSSIILTGIAKGSGMIAPNMATMLAFIMTNANLDNLILKKCLTYASKRSFNSITVDGDTSTSDCVFLGTSNNAGHKKIISFNDELLDDFKLKLTNLCQNLSKQIVSDGEGASKFITIKVIGTNTHKDAKTIAFSIANSPLVKTAIAAGDPNWGRIIMAIGKTGIKINPQLINLYIGKYLITNKGERIKSYNEKKIEKYMKKNEIILTIKLGNSNKEATVWTCDFTSKYIEINSNYRT